MSIVKSGIISLAVLGLAVSPVFASGDKEEKVNICHATSSESNPWEAIQVDESAVQLHLDEHGDFLYQGPTDDKGKPVKKDKEGDQWCGNNVPEEPEEPRDVCENIEGIQEETPEGYTNEDGQCTKDEEPEEPPVDEPKDEPTPEQTPDNTPEKAEAQTLPVTGGGNEFALLGLGITELGLVGSLVVNRLRRRITGE